MKYLLVLHLVVFVGSGTILASYSMVDAMTNQQRVLSGKQFYMDRCSGCHGVEADGNGQAAPMLNPKPRNLVSGSFKLRSTPSGTLPTVEDLLRTIDQGIPGSAMPPFRDLALQEKLALVAYIRSLRPEFKEAESSGMAKLPPPKEIFSNKAGLLAAAKKGKLHYVSACINCHGDLGDGKGPSANDLTDSDDRPIRPANLRGTQLKSGSTASDVYKALSTGLDGTPMPGFDSLFNEQQRWELVAYIFYLRGQEVGIYTEKDKLE